MKERTIENLPVRVELGRTTSTKQPDVITLRLSDKSSGIMFAEVSIDLESFARLVTTQSVEAVAEVVMSDHVGMRHERIELRVPALNRVRWRDRDALIDAALADWLADHPEAGGGWLVEHFEDDPSSMSFGFNYHRMNSDGYLVHFYRYVPRNHPPYHQPRGTVRPKPKSPKRPKAPTAKASKPERRAVPIRAGGAK